MNGVLNVIQQIIDTLGGAETVFAGLGAALSFKNSNFDIASLFGNVISNGKQYASNNGGLGSLFSKDGIKSLFSGVKNNPIKDIVSEFNNGSDIDTISSKFGTLTEVTSNYLSSCESGKANVEELNKALKDSGETSAIVSSGFSGLGTTLKSAGAAVLKFAANFAILMVAMKGIELVVDLFNNLREKTSEELGEIATESSTKYSDTKSEIEELNTELTTTKDRIDELKSKGTLSFAEESELKKLEQQNLALENQIALLEKRAESEAIDAASTAADYVNKEYVGLINSEEQVDKYKGYYEENPDYQFSDSNISALIAQQEIYNEKLAETEKGTQEWQDIYDKVSENTDTLTEKASELTSKMSDMQDGYDLILEKREKGISLTSEEKDIVETYESMQQSIDLINKSLDPEAFKSQKISEIFDRDDLEVTKEELLQLAKAGELENLDLTQYKNLTNALEEAGISAEDFKKDIQGIAGDPEKLYDYSSAIDDLSNKITKVTEDMENYQNALIDSRDSTGLSSDSIAILEARFASLDGYDPEKLFERTTAGMRVNAQELSRLNSEYKNSQINAYDSQLENMRQSYQDLCVEIANTTNAQEKLDLINARESLAKQISQVQDLRSEMAGLTSAWSEWEFAMESANDGANYDSLQGQLENIKKLYSEGLVGTDDFRASVQLMTNQDVSAMSVEELVSVYNKGMPVLEKFFTDGNEGCKRFTDSLISLSKQAGETWATIDDEGNISFDISENDLDTISDKLGMSTEALEQMFLKLSDYGFEIDFSDESYNLQELADAANTAKNSLSEITANDEGLKEAFEAINIDPENIDTLEEVNKELQDIATLKESIQNSQILSEEEKENAVDQLDEITTYLEATKGELTDSVEFTFDTDASIESLNKLLEIANKAAETDYEINFAPKNIGEAEDEIKTATELLNQFKNEDGTVDIELEGAQEAITILGNLIRSKIELGEPEVMNVDTSQLSGDVATTIQLLQDYQSAVEDLQTIQQINLTTGLNLDTSQAQADVDAALANVQSKGDKTILAKLDVDTTSMDTMNASLSKISPEVMVKAGIDESAIIGYKPENKNATVKYAVDSSKVDAFKKKSHNIKATITYSYKTVGSPPSGGSAGVNGTAHAKGTAFARGSWGVGFRGRSLGGEEGRELVVHNDGTWNTIGDNGAEFFNHEPTDIIFNHQQTEDLLSKGFTTGRARAFVNGTAFASGTAFKVGGGGNWSSSGSSSSSKKKRSSSSSKSSSSSSAEDSFEETFDWVERALDLVDRVVKRLDNAIKNVYRDWSDRNAKLNEEIYQLGAQMNYYQSAYNTYMNKANSVPLAENYKQMVQNGQWSIQDITDENLAEQIKEYETWYNKSQEAYTQLEEIRTSIGDAYKQQFDNIAQEYENRIDQLDSSITNLENKFNLSKYTESGLNNDYLNDQIDFYTQKKTEITNEISALEGALQNAVNSGLVGIYSEGYEEMVSTINDLKNELIEVAEDISSVYEDVFDNIATKFDNQIDYIDHYITMLEGYADLAESKGMLASASYYESMIEFQLENLQNLQEQEAELQKQLDNAIDSGAIVQGSEKWYEMTGEIHDTQEAILDANQSLQDFKNEIRDLNWDRFDYLQDLISQITTESEFFIDLLEDNDLFNDNGTRNNYGDTLLGLHGINYNTYMQQADDYAQAIRDLDKEFENDSLNVDYLERRQELVEAQQDFILNAKDEKDAIKDLIEEGYKAQLDYLDELISKRNEYLDSAKDLLSYEKEIAEQVQNVADLQKQIGAFSGDTSEETQKTIQELKVELQNAQDDLEETQYEKYIEDQKALLDTLADEFELWINERLDNFDLMFNNVIDQINASSSTIGDTIRESADSVGYELSDSFNTIFNNKDGEIATIITEYSSNFNSKMTTLQTAIDGIKAGVDFMYKQAKEEADRIAAEQKAKEEAERIAKEEEERKQQEAAAQQAAQQQAAQQQAQQNANERSIFIPKADSYPKDRLNRYCLKMVS